MIQCRVEPALLLHAKLRNGFPSSGASLHQDEENTKIFLEKKVFPVTFFGTIIKESTKGKIIKTKMYYKLERTGKGKTAEIHIPLHIKVFRC